MFELHSSLTGSQQAFDEGAVILKLFYIPISFSKILRSSFGITFSFTCHLTLLSASLPAGIISPPLSVCIRLKGGNMAPKRKEAVFVELPNSFDEETPSLLSISNLRISSWGILRLLYFSSMGLIL